MSKINLFINLLIVALSGLIFTDKCIASNVSTAAYCKVSRIDFLEKNHFYDEHANLVFIQLIFYERNPINNRDEVIYWVMLSSNRGIDVYFDTSINHYVVFIFEKSGPQKIIATSYAETWTQYDRELVNREFLSPDRRRGLNSDKREYYKSRYPFIFR